VSRRQFCSTRARDRNLMCGLKVRYHVRAASGEYTQRGTWKREIQRACIDSFMDVDLLKSMQIPSI